MAAGAEGGSELLRDTVWSSLHRGRHELSQHSQIWHAGAVAVTLAIWGVVQVGEHLDRIEIGIVGALRDDLHELEGRWLENALDR